MEKDFFAYLDECYNSKKAGEKGYVLDRNYRIYKRILPQGFNCKNKFFILKAEKTKLLFSSKGIFSYLSDIAIIYYIIHLPDKYFEIIFQYLNEVLENDFNVLKNITFLIESEEFQGYGIPYFSTRQEFALHSDIKITINEFIFILNFVLTKDILHSNISEASDWYKKSIYKYILLIRYYKYGDKNAKNKLLEINYPINKSLEFFLEQDTGWINKLFANSDI